MSVILSLVIYPLLKNMLGVNAVLTVMNFLFMHQLPHPKLNPIVPSVRQSIDDLYASLKVHRVQHYLGTGFMLC